MTIAQYRRTKSILLRESLVVCEPSNHPSDWGRALLLANNEWANWGRRTAKSTISHQYRTLLLQPATTDYSLDICVSQTKGEEKADHKRGIFKCRLLTKRSKTQKCLVCIKEAGNSWCLSSNRFSSTGWTSCRTSLNWSDLILLCIWKPAMLPILFNKEARD